MAGPRRRRASPRSSRTCGGAPGRSGRAPSARGDHVAELVFDCTGARADKYAVVPQMQMTLRISETSGQRVEAIALRCQMRIEPARRRYTDDEAERLNDLFGETQRWAD